MKFPLSIFSLSLLAGAIASNVLDLDPSNFDGVIGQGKPGLVELYAFSLTQYHAVTDVLPALHPGGMSLPIYPEAMLLMFICKSAVTARYDTS